MDAASKYKVLLLDADNTIFDFDECERHALAATADAFGIQGGEGVLSVFNRINLGLWRLVETGELSRERLRVLRFEKLLSELGVDADARLMSERYVNELSRCAYVIDGMYGVCEALSRRYELYVITNGITSVQESRFAATDITRFFRALFISEKIGVAKPDKRFFDHVVRATGDRPRGEYLIIGDSLTSDIAGGISSGIDTCLFAVKRVVPANIVPTYTVNTPDGLLRLLGATTDERSGA